MAHLKMPCGVVAGLAIAFSLASAPAYPQQPSTPRPTGTQEIDTVVAAWARNSSQIKTLSAQFSRTGRGLGYGSIEYRSTLNWKQSGQAVLETVQVMKNNKTEPFEQIVWTGKEIWLFHPYKKAIEVFRPDRMDEYGALREEIKTSFPGRFIGSRMDLIFPVLRSPKDVDPLPFLIGFDENVAKKRFRFELLQSTDPKQYVIRATPLEPTLKSSYSEVILTLHRERFLPMAFEYHTGRGGREILHYRFLKVALDPVLADDVFEPRKPEGWKITMGSD
jgi:outer membrane lipoprotein-sorting protein